MDWTRRALLRQVLGQVMGGAFAMVGSRSHAFAYAVAKDGIEVLRRGMRIQTVESPRPAYLWVDEQRQRLFVVNEIEEYAGLPTATVESYAIAKGSGLLALISRQTLSLSAVRPRHFAISPDGRFMVVAVYGGGAYNVLPIDGEGRIGPVSQVIKEIGCGADGKRQATAHPHSVVFDGSGKFVVGTDFGCDRINVFAFEDGRLKRIARIATPPGSGPGEVWVEPGDKLEILVEHRLGRFRARYPICFSERPKKA